jgi:hypothetical protein
METLSANIVRKKDGFNKKSSVFAPKLELKQSQI